MDLGKAKKSLCVSSQCRSLDTSVGLIAATPSPATQVDLITRYAERSSILALFLTLLA